LAAQQEDRTREGRYKLSDGTSVPSVTRIIDQLHKPALVPWANRLGFQGIDYNAYLDNAARIGTVAHRLVEARWRGEDILEVEQELIDEFGAATVSDAQASVYEYDSWATENTLEPLLVEAALVSEEHRYGGTVDCVGFLNGKLSVIDLKTGSGIYPEMLIQMAAYAHAVREMYDLNVEQAVMINIPKKRRLKFKVGYADEQGIEIGWKVFYRLLELHYLRVGLDLKVNGK
jgi:hypothetical protein